MSFHTELRQTSFLINRILCFSGLAVFMPALNFSLRSIVVQLSFINNLIL